MIQRTYASYMGCDSLSTFHESFNCCLLKHTTKFTEKLEKKGTPTHSHGASTQCRAVVFA